MTTRDVPWRFSGRQESGKLIAITANEAALPKHLHRSKDLTFEIDVAEMQLEPNGGPRFFVAFITVATAGGRQPVVHRGNRLREVYGPTAEWALRNARHLVDSGAWDVEERLAPAGSDLLQCAG